MTDRAYFAVAVAIYGLCSVYAFFLWRRGFRRDERISYLFLLAAFAFHTTAMFKRGFSLSSCPVNNLYEAITFTLWSITTAYLGLGLWRRFRFVGAFAAPFLFCVGVFALFPELDQHGPEPNFLKGWSSLHASLILLAYGAFGLAFVAGVMYLTQERDLKRHKVRAVLSLLPPMGRLEATIARLILVGFALLTVGLLLGGHTLHTQGRSYSLWDAKIWWSAVVWCLYLGLLLMYWRLSQRGRRMAWGVVASFAFVLLTFWGTNLLSGIHHPQPESVPEPPLPSPAVVHPSLVGSRPATMGRSEGFLGGIQTGAATKESA
jgi:ABC-type transport system involved in cytochrome c biogenesis permease subunit